MLCVLLGGCIIRLHFNCDSEVPAVGTGSTSSIIIAIIIILFTVLRSQYSNSCDFRNITEVKFNET